MNRRALLRGLLSSAAVLPLVPTSPIAAAPIASAPKAYTISLDVDRCHIDLRKLFDQLYGPPAGATSIEVTVKEGIRIGGLNVGEWPEGVRVELTNNGVIGGGAR